MTPDQPLLDAQRAAVLAGVQVRELTTMADLLAADVVCSAIWSPDAGSSAMSVEMMRVFSKTQNYVSGAFLGDRLVGMSAGLRAGPDGMSLHSHIAAVSPDAAGRGVGFAIKLHQRAWCLDRGIETVSWTYDPLIRRNAYLNIAKLGARPAEYAVNFYGVMHDALNRGDETDRVIVAWDLLGDEVSAICRGERTAPVTVEGLAMLVDRVDDRPVQDTPDAHHVGIAVPRDVEALRQVDPDAGVAWRLAVRRALLAELGAGSRVTGFARDGVYVIERTPR